MTWDFMGFIDRDIRERATFEARFLAGRARLAFSPPGTWQRSPQLPLFEYARSGR